MTDSEAFQIAVEVVALQAQACLPPTLEQAELEACVRKCQLAASWQPLAPYPQGATVIPTASNGHFYTCTVAGTSGDIEPAWNQFAGTTTVDGTVTWTESGLERGFYDTDQATFEAWDLKCGKATPLVQNSSAGQSQASQQVFTNCTRMAARWSPYRVS
jgi:hypothetical protein